MARRSGWIAMIAAAACVGFEPPVVAQERAYKFELTPFLAQRFGGSFDERDGADRFDLEDSEADGLVLNVASRIEGQWEILYARQDTRVGTRGRLPAALLDLDVEYLHFGGNYIFDGDATRPFLAFTLGLSQLDPYPSGVGAESHPSASIGGGVRFRSQKRIGVRLEGRVYTTFVDSDSRIFCEGTGGATCEIELESTTLTQWEARAGLVFRF